MLNRMTQEQADEFDAQLHPDAKAENSAAPKPALDRTHLNPHGQQVFGRLVAEWLVKFQVELGPDLIGVPAPTRGSYGPTPAPSATSK